MASAAAVAAAKPTQPSTLDDVRRLRRPGVARLQVAERRCGLAGVRDPRQRNRPTCRRPSAAQGARRSRVHLAVLPIERCTTWPPPPTGLTVTGFPLRIVGSSAAPARVAGVLP